MSEQASCNGEAQQNAEGEQNKSQVIIPTVNWAAFFMPAVWGPAYGFWVSILFYPAWLLADNLLFSAWAQPSALAIVLATLVLAALVFIHYIFAVLGQPIAAQRTLAKGKTIEEYVRDQRKWLVVSVLIAVLFLSLATYYNLCVRTL